MSKENDSARQSDPVFKTAPVAGGRQKRTNTRAKKKWGVVLLAAAVALIALAVILVPKLLPEKASDDAPATMQDVRYLLRADIAEVEDVTVENRFGAYTIHVGGSSAGATLAGVSPDVPLLASRLSSAVTKAVSIFTVREPLALQEGQTASDFGFDDPASVTVRLKGGEELRVELGAPTALRDGYYARAAGSEEICIVGVTFESLAENGVELYIDKTLNTVLTQQDVYQLTEFRLEGSAREEPLVLEKKPELDQSINALRSVLPLSYEVDGDKTDKTVFTYIYGLAAEGVASLDVSESSLAGFGLDAPRYILSLTAGGAEETFRFGAQEAGSIYVMKEGVPVVYTVRASDVPFLDVRLAQIVSPIIYMTFIDTVDTLTVEGGGKRYEFRLTGEGDALAVRCNGRDMAAKDFRSLYQKIIGLTLQGEAEPPASDAVAAAALTFTFRSGGDADVVRYIDIDGRRCFASVNDAGMFYVMLADVQSMLDACEAACAGSNG